MNHISKLSKTTRSSRTKVAAALMLFLISAPGIAPAARAVTTNNATVYFSSPAVVKMGQLGASTASQTLNGILLTEGQIGVMADRILYTEGQIGQMADRIVYVTQFSQTNTILAYYQLTNLVFLGITTAGFSYSATLTQVGSLPAGW